MAQMPEQFFLVHWSPHFISKISTPSPIAFCIFSIRAAVNLAEPVLKSHAAIGLLALSYSTASNRPEHR